jgi:hypothetical protein
MEPGLDAPALFFSTVLRLTAAVASALMEERYRL